MTPDDITETYGCDRHGEDAYQGCAMCDLESLRSRLAEAESRLNLAEAEVTMLRHFNVEADALLKQHGITK